VDLFFSYDALLGLGLTAAFAGGAWLLRAVTATGALAGAVVAFTLYRAAGPGGFLVLLTVFVLTWLSTRLGYVRKQRLGVSEHRRGRSAAQVLANLSVAAVFSALSVSSQRNDVLHLLLVAAMAALAEAAADTTSSECGEALSDRVYLLTTMRRVPVGTDGGVSLPGTAAGVAASFGVAAVAAATHVVPWSALVVVAAAGMLGTVVDSLLGATLERRGVIGNNGVNFFSTLAAAAMALVLMR
jgi:uncharacterized protein (TIGR00297 family)